MCGKQYCTHLHGHLAECRTMVLFTLSGSLPLRGLMAFWNHRHCFAVTPENPDAILLGILPTSLGVTKLSTIHCISNNYFDSVSFIGDQTSIICLLVPKRRLCIGSMIHILMGSK